MIGPGKYDIQLSEALDSVDARQGILIVLDGQGGSGLSAQLSLEGLRTMPQILRMVADQIEADHQKGNP